MDAPPTPALLLKLTAALKLMVSLAIRGSTAEATAAATSVRDLLKQIAGAAVPVQGNELMLATKELFGCLKGSDPQINRDSAEGSFNSYNQRVSFGHGGAA